MPWKVRLEFDTSSETGLPDVTVRLSFAHQTMALKLVHNPVSSGRAAALRGVLDSSEVIAKEAVQVLNGYGNHLNELIESVEHVADRAQASLRFPKR